MIPYGFVYDLEYDLMGFCLREKGKWWANRLFRNKEVNDRYDSLRGLSLDEVLDILRNEPRRGDAAGKWYDLCMTDSQTKNEEK